MTAEKGTGWLGWKECSLCWLGSFRCFWPARYRSFCWRHCVYCWYFYQQTLHTGCHHSILSDIIVYHATCSYFVWPLRDQSQPSTLMVSCLSVIFLPCTQDWIHSLHHLLVPNTHLQPALSCLFPQHTYSGSQDCWTMFLLQECLSTLCQLFRWHDSSLLFIKKGKKTDQMWWHIPWISAL